MGRTAVAVVVFALAFAPTGASHPQGSSGSVSPELRLLGAIKLWGDIRFFDPQVSEGGVDWDSAFMNAEPALLAATTPASYGGAVQSMLAPLNDPATRVNATPQDTLARIAASPSGSGTVIAFGNGTPETPDAFITDAKQAVATAAKGRAVLFDLRGVSDSNAAGSSASAFFTSSDFSIGGLISGDVALPRERSRSYLGYPDDSGTAYQGYSATDSIADAGVLSGMLKTPIRLGFLVDDSTSLPTLAIALAAAGKAAIYSTRGQPSVSSGGSLTLQLPDGIVAAYRTADLADIAERQPFASGTATSVADALAKLQTQSPSPMTYATATAPPERFNNKAYAGENFPPEPMRMLAVARIYNVIRYFSPYRALMHDDWDAAALQAIRDERAATDARSYLMGLLRFYTHLHDSHGGFPIGKFVATEFGFGPPFVARYLHGQVVVTHTLPDVGPLHGLRIGDVIETVDGVPVRTAMQRVESYICSSTQQSADYSALSVSGHPSIFSGSRGTPVTLQFHHPGSNATLTATFLRGVIRAQPVSSPEYFVMPGNVGYVDFDRIRTSEVDAMFAALKNTRAIVFDNRGYPQGTAWAIAPRLTTATTVRLALFNTPFVIEPLSGQEGEEEPIPTYRQFYQMLGRAAGPRYLKPTVMLIDERAISQSEHSALFFRATGHTRFVGMPTRGANGDVTSMVLPGEIYFNFSGEGVRWPDGRQLQRVGIIPDVRVEPTAADIGSGNDVILQRGLDEALRLTGATKQQRNAAVRQEISRERRLASLSS